MANSINFGVSPNLAMLLGESYRKSEIALKELVDNAWDADATRVDIFIPSVMTSDPIVIDDNGHGMSQEQIVSEYLSIARNRRSIKGNLTTQKKRRVKGRKGIGKFAGLSVASIMRIETVSDEIRSILTIDKKVISECSNDIEQIPLPIRIEKATGIPNGTRIILSELNQNLNFPNPDTIRTLLIYEYGRETDIKIMINGVDLNFTDLPGEEIEYITTLPHIDEVKIRFKIAKGKLPKNGGFALRVNGKLVGDTQWFGIDEIDSIPSDLKKRVFGIVEIEGIEGLVTSDGGALIESSKAYGELIQCIKEVVKSKLEQTYQNEIKLQESQLNSEIKRRLKNLPEHRREFARIAIARILSKFYKDRPDRRNIVISVMLDALERDEYWEVLQKIQESKQIDIAAFADSLESFGLIEMSFIANSAKARKLFLDQLDDLIKDTKTHEMHLHKAFEKNLWIFGYKYHLMSSNQTLKNIIDKYANENYSDNDESIRPDLLLNTDNTESYLLIEFKRPNHAITRKDEFQAQNYVDKLRPYFPNKDINVFVIGGFRDPKVDGQNQFSNIKVYSYAEIVIQARQEINWLLKDID